MVFAAELAATRSPLEACITIEVGAFCGEPKGEPEISCRVAPPPIENARIPVLVSPTYKFLEALSDVRTLSAGFGHAAARCAAAFQPHRWLRRMEMRLHRLCLARQKALDYPASRRLRQDFQDRAPVIARRNAARRLRRQSEIPAHRLRQRKQQITTSLCGPSTSTWVELRSPPGFHGFPPADSHCSQSYSGTPRHRWWQNTETFRWVWLQSRLAMRAR